MKTFNIFQVAEIWKSEEIHTRVIAELLDPNSQFHDMGIVFLEKFLEKLKLGELDKQRLHEDLSKAKDKAKDTTAEDIIKVETEVLTDNGRRIDMVIKTEKYYIPFEVKIWAGDQESQLYDYYDYAKKQGKTVPCIYYLTPDGHNPSDWSLVSTDGKQLPGEVCNLSFQENILPWLDDCIKNTETPIPVDVLEIMKQLRDNIQRYPRHRPGHMCFSQWGREDILDEIYQTLCQKYNLSWTECTYQYMTCTLKKEGELEFALRIQKEGENSVSLHLLYGITQEGKPNYALTVPHIRENPQEYEVLLSNTFANRENVFDSTVASKWDRMKVIHCKKQDGTCIEKIEEVFSWLKDGIREK